MAGCERRGDEFPRPISVRRDRCAHDYNSLECAHGIVAYSDSTRTRSQSKCVRTGNIAAPVPDQLPCDSLIEMPLRSVNRVPPARRGVRLLASGQLSMPY